MTLSSVQQDYLTTLSSLDTITLTGVTSSVSVGYTSPTYTLNTTSIPSISSISISTGGSGYVGAGTASTGVNWSSDWKINLPEEFVNAFPEWARIEDMCKEYPGLKIAFDKFKTTYYLVKDDYDNPHTKK